MARISLVFAFMLGWVACLWSQYAYPYHPITQLDNLGLSHHPSIQRLLDLKGPVYTIRIDEVPMVRSGNRWVEGRRRVRFTALFDPMGRLLEESAYSETSDLLRRSGFIKDAETGMDTYQVFRARNQRLWMSTPVFNRQGLIERETLVLEDHSTETRYHIYVNNLLHESRQGRHLEIYRYDTAGLLTEVSVVQAGSTSQVRRILRNAEGLPVAVEWYQDGQPVHSSTFTYNDQGQLLTQEFEEDGQRILVEYSQPDSQGNWTRRVHHRIQPDGGRIPLVTYYRRITYYPSR